MEQERNRGILKNPWIYVSVIILIILFFLLKPVFTGKTIDGELDNFAKCLTDAGMKMYGTDWCSHCQNQKKLFGKSFEQIDFTDCDWDSEICSSEGIRGYPTWKIDGESYPGKQSLERLAQLSGCEL